MSWTKDQERTKDQGLRTDQAPRTKHQGPVKRNPTDAVLTSAATHTSGPNSGSSLHRTSPSFGTFYNAEPRRLRLQVRFERQLRRAEHGRDAADVQEPRQVF